MTIHTTPRAAQLFLRTTDKDGKAHSGFQWPMEVGATVTAPDWKPTKECGNGLHGLLDGLDDSSHLSFDPDALWWIVEADDAIDLDGKHKFRSCKVVAFGPRHEVTAHLHAMRPGPIHGLCLTGGNYATLTGGYESTLTGGYGSTLTGGYESTLIFLRWIAGRRRVLTAYVGEDGIRPGVAYRANEDHSAVVPA
jgi:hypothetical protein